jgi:hypothetical protein
MYIIIDRSWFSAVGRTTGYGLDYRGFRVRVEVRSIILISPCPPHRLWGSPNLQGALYPRIKQQEFKANHSPPSSADVKKTWGYSSTPPYVFMM